MNEYQTALKRIDPNFSCQELTGVRCDAIAWLKNNNKAEAAEAIARCMALYAPTDKQAFLEGKMALGTFVKAGLINREELVRLSNIAMNR